MKKICPVYAGHCPVHGFWHGAEAEELRKGIEKILEVLADPAYATNVRRALQGLLDRVDARDSLAYLEAKDIEEQGLLLGLFEFSMAEGDDGD